MFLSIEWNQLSSSSWIISFVLEQVVLTQTVQWGSPTGTISGLTSSNFAAKSTSFDLVKAMSNKSGPDYQAILSDMKAISAQIQLLQTNNVPILFRPLVRLILNDPPLTAE